MSRKSLKSEYQKWLWMLAVADLIALLFLAGVPGISNLTELANWRLLTTVVIPIVVLLVVNVLSHKVKCTLVYWRRYGWLPGCEVFTKYSPADPRIDMDALQRNVGTLPTDPNTQNAVWYRLYKQVEDQPEISDAQRNFLMYRDMAVLSLPFIPLAPLFLHLAEVSERAQWLAAGLFLLQYIQTAVSARHSGIRFVTNVLALHSARGAPTGIVQLP
jgi:hypothetical protein